MAGWGETKSLNNNDSGPKLTEQMELMSFPDNKWVRVRFIGPIASTCNIYVNRKKKDGTVNPRGFPVVCLDYDPKTQSFTKDICPWRGAGLKTQQRFFSNVIVRSLEKKAPRKKTRVESEKVRKNLLGEKFYLKDMTEESWTPVRVFSFPPSVLTKVQELMELNEHKGKIYSVADPKYGFDVLIKKNPNASTPADTWSVQKEGRTPLTEQELKYLLFQLDVSSLHPKPLKEAKEDFKRNAPYIVVRGEDQKWHPLKKKKDVPDDIDDDDSGDIKRRKLSLEDDDEDETPKRKKKVSSKTSVKRKKPESEKPVKKKKTRLSLDDDRPKKKKKRKPVDLDDEIPF